MIEAHMAHSRLTRGRFAGCGPLTRVIAMEAELADCDLAHAKLKQPISGANLKPVTTSRRSWRTGPTLPVPGSGARN